MRLTLDVGFLGKRNYIQGGSVFSALEAAGSTFSNGSASFISHLLFRGFTQNLCEVSSEAPKATERLVGEGRYRLPDKTELDFWLIQTERKAASRQPFDEERLIAPALVDDVNRLAVLSEYGTGFTTIQAVIALTKLLNYKVMPDVSGKWVFAQIDLTSQLPATYHVLEIRMTKAVKDRFSVNEIVVDQELIGRIRFIVGDPG